MPSVSKKQHNFMAAVAHSPAFAKKVGVSQSVGQDFNKADKGRKFSKGGDTMATKMNPSAMKMMPAKAGSAKKMAGGGLAAGHKSADGVATKGKTTTKQIAMKKGGKC